MHGREPMIIDIIGHVTERFLLSRLNFFADEVN